MSGALVPLQRNIVTAYTGDPALGEAARLLALAFLAGYAGRTRQAYEIDLRQWFAWCDSVGVTPLAITRAHAQVYARQLADAGRAPATIARKLAAVTGFYGYAVTEGQLGRSPLDHVRRPKVPDESPRLGLDKTELGALLAAANTAGPVEHALVCLLALNGLRVSEACGATYADLAVEREHRTVTVTRKGGRRDQVALAPRTVAAIDALTSASSAGTAGAWGTAAGHGGAAAVPLLGLTRYGAWRLIRRLVTAAGITKAISPHSLRHSFVTLSLEAGVPLHEVQDGAGHADPRTTMRYDRARKSLDRAPTYRLAAFLDDA